MFETRSSLILRLGPAANKTGWDETSWREFVATYHAFLYRKVLRWGVAIEDAKDLVQDILIKLPGLMPKFEPSRGKLRTLLQTVARNSVIDWLRLKQRGETSLDSDSQPVVCDTDFETRHRQHVLQTALETVRHGANELTWACFEYHVLRRLTAEEVALELGISSNAVYVNSSRILGRVREFCERFGETL
ncbi:MAG: sigma-70 family RNA polymerase sigma factor [Planctomycetaceae bacterium]|nr:sigma-70 family RNA polymerase sigma factor [Planctomycetaceae bacterium]